MKEIKVDNIIKRDLESYGTGMYWRKKQANTYQKNGTADYYGSYRGKYFSIEAKAGNGHPLSMAQMFDGYLVVKAGGVFIVAFPDYTTFTKIKRCKINLDFGNTNRCNELSIEDYGKLENLCRKLNSDRKTVMFY